VVDTGFSPALGQVFVGKLSGGVADAWDLCAVFCFVAYANVVFGGLLLPGFGD
jgi:hypothetical protein